jgi:hypothetical protein
LLAKPNNLKTMKLSEDLKQCDMCGDFGRALEGYPERAEKLEVEVERWKKAIIPFLAVHAAQYGKEHYGEGGMHYTHYDMLQEAGARMVAYKRCGEGSSIANVEVRRGDEASDEVIDFKPSPRPACSAMWFPADQPPDGERGCWSRKVIVLMMSGEAHRLSYFHDDKTDDGRWQRPKGMAAGDMPMWWIDPPNADVEARRK